MRRLLALLRKELAHHWTVLFALVAFLPFAFALVALSVYGNDEVTLLNCHLYFTWIFVPLTAVVLAHRLVVIEYFGQTQLFVEALPLRRWEMVLVKHALGLATVTAVTLCSLCCGAALALWREPVSASFFALMAGRSLSFAFWLWSVLFFMGFLGRLRVPVYLALAFSLVALDAYTGADLTRFGPFDLIDYDLVLDRQGTELGLAYLVSLLSGGACTALAVALASFSEGSIAESLARRMTLKEKSVVALLFVVAFIVIEAAEPKKRREPYSFNHERVLRSQGGDVHILYLDDQARADAAALLEVIEADRARLRQLLGPGTPFPSVHVALREDMDGSEVAHVPLDDHDGLLLRANFHDREGWAGAGQRQLRIVLIEQTLLDATAGRADFEPRAWTLDGVGPWLVDSQREDCRAALPSCQTFVQAAWLTGPGGESLSEQTLHRWLLTRERHGEALARALAASALFVVAAEQGGGAVDGLIGSLFGGPAPARDSRVVIDERLHPVDSVFFEATGLAYSRFVELWNERLDRARSQPQMAALMTQIGSPQATLVVERRGGEVRDLVARFDPSSPLPPGAVVTLLHQELGPFDGRPTPRDELPQQEYLVTEGGPPDVRLRGLYGAGARVFVAVEVSAPLLGCPMRAQAQRLVVR